MKRLGGLLLTIATSLWISAHPALGRGEPMGVVTSVIPVAYIVKELGGERVRVHALVPPGASPHTFEPVPSDLRKLAQARLFVVVGGGFDAWSDKLLGAAPKGLETLTLFDAPNLKPLEGDDDHHGEEQAAKEGGKKKGEEEEELNPHFWLDPIRVRDAVVPVVVERLMATDPGGKEYYRKRREDFHRRLTALDVRIGRELDNAKTRKYVAFHAAWPYFAERYGLERVAVVQEFGGEEPTPREVGNLVRDARAAGVGAILVEPQLSPRVARTIAAEFGAKTVLVDPVGDPGDPARSNYEALMLFNTRAFGRALEGKRN